MLFRINTSLVREETEIKEVLQLEFMSYTRDINPDLLFEGLENTIVSLRNNEMEQVDKMVDHLSYLYRYILARRDKELVFFETEVEAVEHLVELNNLFPYKSIELQVHTENKVMIIPSSIISIVDNFLRSCIPTNDFATNLNIIEANNEIELKLDYIGRIDDNIDEIIDYWKRRYKTFTDSEWGLTKDEFHIVLKIPTLKYVDIESPTLTS